MTELHLTLPGSIRSKKNSKRIYSCGRFKRVLPSKAYEDWEQQARIHFQFYHARFPVLSCPVSVEAHIYYSGKQPDLSGCCESIGDSLEGYVWENDSQIYSWDGSRLYHDKKNPRTEITVRWEV